MCVPNGALWGNKKMWINFLLYKTDIKYIKKDQEKMLYSYIVNRINF